MTGNAIRTLVEKSSRGDTDAFKELYEALVDRIFGYIASRTDRTTATDLTQDSFVELYKALPSCTYRSDPEFHGFVFAIVKRVLAKHYGNKHTKANALSEPLDESVVAAPATDHSERLSIAQALETLDEATREIIRLHHWSRYTFPEISALMHMTESAVRTRHHRALAVLAAQLTTSRT
jgi:RNA polymerase sigma-70 factor, ECF subfamily